MYPSDIPDLSLEGPLILSGRYKGSFPETLKAKGVLADFSDFVIDMKIQKAKDIPLQKVKYLSSYMAYSRFRSLLSLKIIISSHSGGKVLKFLMDILFLGGYFSLFQPL